jgi:hypothetical protein
MDVFQGRFHEFRKLLQKYILNIAMRIERSPGERLLRASQEPLTDSVKV